MLSSLIRNLSILKKFLLINLVIFIFIGTLTIIYLNYVQPNLIKKKSAYILKKFLIINLIVFSVLGLFTIIYLEAIQPNLVKERSDNHKIVINLSLIHI